MLFEIVDCLNRGIELVTEQSERNKIAKLNLIAAQKAKLAIAYNTAQKYLTTARECLADSSWKTNYDLTLDLYKETTEVDYLCGQFGRIESWAAIVVQQAKTVLDAVKVYEVKIQTYIAQNQPLKAIDTGLQVLQQLGIEFPENPSQSDISLELDAIVSLFNKKRIENSIDLPEMTAPDKLAAMQILSSITVSTYIAAPNLMPLLASKQVNLSIEYGNAFASPVAYALCGLILCEMVGNIEFGYQFGQLALRQLSQSNTRSLKARTLMFVNIFTIHRKKHIREILQPLLEAYQSGLETGDIEFAAYCTHTYSLQSFIVGMELVEVEREIKIFSELNSQLKQEAVVNWFQISQQFILNLRRCLVNPTRLIGKFYNEENRLTQHEEDGFAIFLLYFNKLILCYLFSEYDRAVENSTIAKNYLLQVRATPAVPLYYLYDSLARLAVYPENSQRSRERILQKVAINQEKIEQWADDAPMNYLHKYNLVRAEIARVLGQLLEAEEFYERAIQGAKENGYIQEEALAYELAAKFYLSRGREKFAQTYMKEAHYCYDRWGATAKVTDLETRYPQLFSHLSGAVSPIGTTSNASQIDFDLAAILKASQAFSSEIELDRLLGSLMKILIENAGAQIGFLILENLGEWTIEASCICGFNNCGDICVTQMLQSLPMANHLPESIVRYVIRTHESVILNDATREGDFIHDPYIQNNQTRSLLCLPLLDRGKLVGVVYLENKLAPGVFTPERSQVLNLLSTQAAIAIENAKLYSKLRASENKIAQFLEAVPVGIVTVNPRGHLDYFNQRAIQLLGRGIDLSIPSEQISEIYQLYLAGGDRPYPTDELPGIRALKGECSTVDDVEIHQNDDAIIPVEVWGTPVFNELGEVIYAIAAFQDISDRKRAEQLLADYNLTLERQVAERTAALRESEATLRGVYDELRLREQELQTIADALPVCIFYTGIDRRYRFVNKTCELWFECSRDEIIGKHARKILGEEAYRIVEPYIDRVLKGESVTYEAELSYVSGKKYISATYIPDFDLDDRVKGYYGLITDISEQRNAALRERKRTEEALILEERNRMAREIHDTLAQAFTSIIVHLDAASQRIKLDPDSARSYLKTGRILALSGLADARRSVEALRPQILEEGNLQSALDRLAAQMFSHTPIQLVCKTIGEPFDLPQEVEANLFRIGQEALTNTFKHANASKICIELRYGKSQLVLQIEDDGRGFENISLPVDRGFGLLGMTERAERIGAELRIQSHLGQGTKILVRVQTR